MTIYNWLVTHDMTVHLVGEPGDKYEQIRVNSVLVSFKILQSYELHKKKKKKSNTRVI